MHKLQHLPAHDDDSLSDSHIVRKSYVAGDSRHQEMLSEMRHKCNKNHSQDSPSDNIGTQLLNNFHQKPYCGQQEAILLSEVQSASILQGR